MRQRREHNRCDRGGVHFRARPRGQHLHRRRLEDPEDISAWAWKDGGGLPDKDNLRDAFAARYTVAGEEILYFGSDRFANDGDAQQGFWFLQNEVTRPAARSAAAPASPALTKRATC